MRLLNSIRSITTGNIMAPESMETIVRRMEDSIELVGPIEAFAQHDPTESHVAIVNSPGMPGKVPGSQFLAIDFFRIRFRLV